MSTAVSERALTLLGSGAGPELVASALGVTTSAITQLMSEEGFAKKVIELRYQSLAKHVGRDQKADRIEDLLLDKLESVMAFVMDPMKLVMMYRTINQAKRRSASAPEAIAESRPIQSITMPTMIVQHFSTNIQNQIVKIGEQDLVTIQSGRMDTLLAQSKEDHGHAKTQPELISSV